MRTNLFRRLAALALALICVMSASAVRAEDSIFPLSGMTLVSAKLYSTASTSSKVLTTIPKNASVTLSNENGDYFVVLYQGRVGFVLKSAIQADGYTQEQIDSSIYPVLAPKDDGEQVLALQQALKELGFYTGELDGKYGSGTRKAVAAFQKANSLKESGTADAATQMRLYEGTCKNSKGKAVTVKTAPALMDYVLSTGNTGIAVEKLQLKLKQLGYYTRTVDGTYGSSTAAAVKAFQKANGLTRTGRADKKTQELIYNGDASIIGKKTATPKVKATATPKPTAEPKATFPFTTYTLTSVNLRKAASTASTRLLTVPKGAEVEVSAVTGDFVKVTYKGKVGYLAAEFVKVPTQYLPGKALSADSEAQQHYPYLQTGSTGAYVSVLQEALKELGFYAGAVDGAFGATTASALKAFQKKNAIRQDSIATPEVQKLILEGRPLNAKGKRTNVKILPLIPDLDLHPGDKGEAVAELQNQLIILGLYKGQPTGTFSSATENAVREFQKLHNLYVDGIVGKKTRQLLTLLAVTATPKAAATPTPAPKTTKKATAAPTPTATPLTAKNVVVMRSGTKGEAVKRLQQRLMDLRYYTCTVDGIYNADDIAAVKAFQRKNGLKIDGIAGLETQLALYSDSALPATTVALITTTPVPAATATPKNTAPAIPTGTLRLGDSGDAVKSLQTRLKALGYYTGKADGIFGTGTATAVTAFQKAAKLTADGIAGAKTLGKLFDSSAPSAGKTAATATPAPAVNLLRTGDQGTDVRNMQKKLVALGYLTVADGIYGIRTYNAVVNFQKRNGLKADGIAGTMTLNRLNSTAAVPATGTVQATATPVPVSPGRGSFKAPSASEVRNANWYSEIRDRAKLMPDVVIYDPDTGLHFNLHMFSLGKHADSEPPTAADTDVLNQICGVNSWTPHYVWVIFTDGRVYIGSIHSHGHSVDHTSGNNLEGHICLHFPRVMSEAEATGPYAVSHQKEILYGWEVTQALAK